MYRIDEDSKQEYRLILPATLDAHFPLLKYMFWTRKYRKDRRTEQYTADDGGPADGAERTPGNAEGIVCPPENLLPVNQDPYAVVHGMGHHIGREVQYAGTGNPGD